MRTIPLAEWLIDDLAEAVTRRSESTGVPAEPSDRLFTSPRGKPMLDPTLWRIVNRACYKAGLQRIRPYDLRHSHASLRIDIGAHPKAISERMGSEHAAKDVDADLLVGPVEHRAERHDPWVFHLAEVVLDA